MSFNRLLSKFIPKFGFIIGVFVIAALFLSLWHVVYAQMSEAALKSRPSLDSFIFDFANTMNEDSKSRIDGWLARLYKEQHIEFIGVSVDSLNGEGINLWANKLFQNWQIGYRTKPQLGLLLVVAVKDKQVRLEVGYGLEHVFTDAFIGYIENEQMKPFFEQGRIGPGFEATLELIIAKLQEKTRTGAYSTDAVNSDKTEYLSGGAGAQRKIDIGSVAEQPKPVVTGNLKERFTAQDTPEKTLALYFEASRMHIKDPDLGIYTSATKEFFRKWTVTNAQQDSERQFDNVSAKTKIQGDYAVAYYPDKDWTFNPFFLHKSSAGWQLDFATMSKVISFNEHNYWMFTSREHPYMFAFDEYQIDSGGFVWFKRTATERGYLNISFSWGVVPMEIKIIASGSAAERAGIKAGDSITHINGKDVRSIGFSAAVNEAVGAIGTAVTLRAYRKSENRSIDFTIVREREI